MSKVVTAIAELPEEALKEWREWIEAQSTRRKNDVKTQGEVSI